MSLLFTLNSVTKTLWIDISQLTEAVNYIITGSGAWVIGIEFSNNVDFDKGTDWIASGETWEVPSGPLQVQARISRFVRFSMSSYTSGAAVISFAKAVGIGGELYELQTQTFRTPNPSSL